MSKHTKLTKPEGVLISEWKKQGLCGKVKIDKVLELIYEPNHAQFVAMERKQKAFNAKQPLKSKLKDWAIKM